jgi:hypothetical protein
MVVAPPGEARTRVDGLFKFISVLIRVDMATALLVKLAMNYALW